MLLKNVYLCLLLEGKANEEVYEKDRIVVDCRDDDFTVALHNKCWYYSLQIPVNVAYTFTFTDVHLSVFAGPTFDWSLFGKMKSRETNPDLHFGVSEEKDLKPCDFGMNVGLSVEYSNFFFSVSSLCGMIDRRALKRDGETSVYQNNVTFSLGYYFRK